MFFWCCESTPGNGKRDVDRVLTIKVLAQDEAEEVLENTIGPTDSGDSDVATEAAPHKALIGPPPTLSEEKTATSLEPLTPANADPSITKVPPTVSGPLNLGSQPASLDPQDPPSLLEKEPRTVPPPPTSSSPSDHVGTESRAPSHGTSQRSAASTPRPASKSRPKAIKPGSTFDISLKRQDKHTELGLDVGRADSAIKIKKVVPGLVADHNRAHPLLALQAKDLIIAVNGAKGSADQLLAAVGSVNTLVLTIRRP